MRRSRRAPMRSKELRRAPATALVVVALGLALTGCGTSSATSPASVSPSTSATASAGKVDVAREATHPDPNFDYGFTILITDGGFEPHWLVSECCKDITWRNTTSSPVTVTFDHQQVTSTPIPPGGTFVWLPKNIQSVTYHDVGDPSLKGIIQVNQTFES